MRIHKRRISCYDNGSLTSGALAYFEAQQDTVTVSGSMGRPRHGFRQPDVGQVFANTEAGVNARGVSNALGRLDNPNSLDRIETNAEAKPIGRIKTEIYRQ